MTDLSCPRAVRFMQYSGAFPHDLQLTGMLMMLLLDCIEVYTYVASYPTSVVSRIYSRSNQLCSVSKVLLDVYHPRTFVLTVSPSRPPL